MRRKLFPALKPEMGELLHLDFLRLVSASAIVIFHFWYDLDLEPATLQRWARVEGLVVFVDVFFVLSGIVIAWVYTERMASWADYGRFLQKRVARLVPLHWATLIFYVILGFVGARLGEALTAGRYDGSCLLSNIAMIHASGICKTTSYNGVSWSISAEMFMYLLFPVFLFLQRRSAGGLLILALGIVAGLFAFDWIQHPVKLWPDRTFDGGVLRAFPAFLIGMSAYAYRSGLVRFRYWGPVGVIAFFVCVDGVLLNAPKTVIVPSAYLMAVAAFGSDLRGKVSEPVRCIAPLGQLTYSLYMLHPVVGVVFIKVLGIRVLRLQGDFLAAWALLALPISVGVAYLSLIWFETPARRWITRRPIGYLSSGDAEARLRQS